MLRVYEAPTVETHVRTLLADYATWKTITMNLDQGLARSIEQALYRQKDQKLIRIDFSVENANRIKTIAKDA